MENIFDNIVDNALDFLEKSIREIESGEAKYAVIHFYSGLELFVKARLFREHWSLVSKDVSKVSNQKVEAGEFESVGLEEARKRLDNLLDSKIEGREFETYDRLRNRRNQAIHFYHSDDLDNPKRVAAEQLAGWNYLYCRLSGPWRDSFERFQYRLGQLHGKFSEREEFYPAIFAEMATDIQKRAKKGRLLSFCPNCLQRSALTIGPVATHVQEMECLVCRNHNHTVFYACGGCGKLAPRQFGLENRCQFCEHANPASFGESQSRYAPTTPTAWCGRCGYTVEESVVKLEGGSLCLACHDFDEVGISYCEWCASKITGDVGDRLRPGCTRCGLYIAYTEQGEPAPTYMTHPAERWVRPKPPAPSEGQSAAGKDLNGKSSEVFTDEIPF